MLSKLFSHQVKFFLSVLFLALVAQVSMPALAQPAGQGVVAGQPQKLPQSRLTIRTADGKTVKFTVEVASTPEQQTIGMMFRASMPQDNGMLFVYAQPQPLAYWMENTFLPLDLIFIGKDGRILNIVANAKPLSRQPLLSVGAAIGVLELNGGQAATLGIAPGDRVEHPKLAVTAGR